jgi:hypothetical protein
MEHIFCGYISVIAGVPFMKLLFAMLFGFTNQKIRSEYEAWRRAGLFRREVFSFPPPHQRGGL